MSVQNAAIALIITAIGAGSYYLYDKYNKQKIEMERVRAVVEPLLKDVPGYNKPSR